MEAWRPCVTHVAFTLPFAISVNLESSNSLQSFWHVLANIPFLRWSLAAQIYADPNGPGVAGNVTKALYRAYRDASFTDRLQQPAQHGILGPILHASIGDNITVVFQV